MLHYHITPYALEQHLWQVRLCFHQRQKQSLSFSLPNWVPGSYMIREFARHILLMTARHNGTPVALTQSDKNTWHVCAEAGEWVIEYRVYAFDLSVRGAWLTRERGFFDGACVFLRHNQRRHEPCRLSLNLPSHWQLATSLPATDEANTFQAASYTDLIDHPFEAGTLIRLPFCANGIDHEIVISGHHDNIDTERLRRDVQQICQTQQAFFPSPAPFRNYVFLLHVGDGIYGGLEHRSSTALLADRHSLPRLGATTDDAYVGLLGLFSHEYFHAWNVKSIKPQAFADSDLNSEAYSEQLWAFEGITSYYDDLFLIRSGVISLQQYLQLLAKNLTRVQHGGGRKVQTLAESSFNAWTKYYKPNENSPNALASYYQQGALMALCLDSHIRQHSHSTHSLDTVMQSLYRDHLARGCALTEGEWQQHAQAVTGVDLQDFFQAALYSTADLPLPAALQYFGIDLQWQALPRNHGGAVVTEQPAAAPPTADLGARFTSQPGAIRLTHVFNGGSAETAGLCAGDDIIALNRIACCDFNAAWQRVAVGDTLDIHYFRHSVLQHTQLTALAATADTALLRISDEAAVRAWLQNTPKPID